MDFEIKLLVTMHPDIFPQPAPEHYLEVGVVTSGITSPLIWVISRVTLLITPLIATHEPPSNLTSTTGQEMPASQRAV